MSDSGTTHAVVVTVNGERYDASWAYEPFYDYLKEVLDQP